MFYRQYLINPCADLAVRYYGDHFTDGKTELGGMECTFIQRHPMCLGMPFLRMPPSSRCTLGLMGALGAFAHGSEGLMMEMLPW
jgi:hypothetical protein